MFSDENSLWGPIGTFQKGGGETKQPWHHHYNSADQSLVSSVRLLRRYWLSRYCAVKRGRTMDLPLASTMMSSVLTPIHCGDITPILENTFGVNRL